MLYKNALHTIRILNKNILVRGERPEQMVEVSWEEDLSREITHTISGSYIRELLLSWENFIQMSWQNSSTGKNPNNNSPSLIQEFSQTWESLLFGGKTWIKSHHERIRFITDLEWNGIPFEILPYSIGTDKENAHDKQLLIDNITLYRSIRMEKDPPGITDKIKKNREFLIWMPGQLDKSVQESIDSEREKLENLLQNRKIEYDTINHVGSSSQLFFKKLSNHRYIHYAGHTEKDHIPLKNGNRIYYEDILSMDLSNLEVVFWNSCFSGRQSPGIEGLVGKVLSSGVQNFIGFLGPVETGRAEKAGLLFWEYYLATGDIQFSIDKTRESLRREFGEEDLTAYLLAFYSYGITLNKSRANRHYHKLLLYAVAATVLIGLIGIGLFFPIFDKNPPRDTEVASEDILEVVSKEAVKKKTRIRKPKSSPQKEVVEKKNHTEPGQRKAAIPAKKQPNIERMKDPIYNKPDILWTNVRDPKYRAILKEFWENKKSLYSQKQKIRIIREIENRVHEDEEVRAWRFRQKTGL